MRRLAALVSVATVACGPLVDGDFHDWKKADHAPETEIAPTTPKPTAEPAAVCTASGEASSCAEACGLRGLACAPGCFPDTPTSVGYLTQDDACVSSIFPLETCEMATGGLALSCCCEGRPDGE